MSAKNLVFDLLIALAYLVTANPALSGLMVHEWLALGLVITLVIHAVSRRVWLAAALQPVRPDSWRRLSLRLVIDAALLVTLGVTVMSGIMMSRHALFSLGMVAYGYFSFVSLHAVSAKLLLVFVVAHVIVNARRIGSFFRKRKMPHENAAEQSRLMDGK